MASTLVTHQQRLGYPSKLHTMTSTNLRDNPLRNPLLTGAAALDTYLISSEPSHTMFGHFRKQLGLFDLKVLEPNSSIHLHWVSGLLNHQNLKGLLDSGRRVVWTLHDMAPFTGGCHHSHNCLGYEGDCRDCPQSRSAFKKKVVGLKLQEQFTKMYPNLTLATPTRWLEGQVERSSRFRGFEVVTIPNPISEEFFTNLNPVHRRRQLGISDEDVVFLSIAADLSDSSKGVGGTVDYFRSRNAPEKFGKVLLLVGANGHRFHEPKLGVIWLGEMDAPGIAEIACGSDWVISNSIAESAGMTIAECGALGIPAISLESGASSEMIKDGETGLIARNEIEFRDYLTRASAKTLARNNLGESAKRFARKKFHPDVIAKKYLDLY